MNRRISLAVFVVLLTGCYALQPARGPEPKNGDQVAFEITDAGRVFLGGAMGPEIDLVEGRLLDSENGEYVLGVTSVKTLRGGVQVWSGERVRIEKQHVSRMYEKRFSRGRTMALGVVMAGGMAILFGKSLGVFGGERQPDPNDTTIIVDEARPRFPGRPARP
jgi:hypothetical protein